MFFDLIIGIASSLIASVIVGFLGNKVLLKQNSIILKLYVYFLSVTVFICCVISCIILNQDFGERIGKISETNLLKFYSNCINSFVWIITIVAGMTLAVILLEGYDRSARREHKENMDRYKQLR